MTEMPIIFSGEMVRAILDGRKTQTRRVIKTQPKDGETLTTQFFARYNCPYGTVEGRMAIIEDSLAVRILRKWLPCMWTLIWKWFVIEWVQITHIRVERVKDIGTNGPQGDYDFFWDTIADEGYPHALGPKNRHWIEWFVKLWNSIYGPDAWTLNYWVWVIEFRRVDERK